MPPLLIQVFSPFRRQPSAVGSARIAIAATSEPASGSLSAKAAIFLPWPTAVRYCDCCSGVPSSVIAPLPRPCIAKAKSASGEW
ncbi:hypothetical protein D9M69_615680 [compost metagenome]